MKTINDLKPGESGVIKNINIKGDIKQKLFDMGVTPGTKILLKKFAPFGDPIQIKLRGYNLSFRKNLAKHIVIE